MKLIKIKITNIRSYADQEIIFPNGSLLLAGNVGAGKTSILLAIEYALFGLQPGQKGSALIRNNSDTASVLLEFEVDEHKVIIERSLKRDKRSVTSDYASITIDGDKIECSTTELKTKILDLLKYPSDFVKKNNLLYKYTVYTPQENLKQIILEDSETRFSVLRYIFGVDKYKRIRENLSLMNIRLKDEIKILQAEVNLTEQDKFLLTKTKLRIEDILKLLIVTDTRLKEKINMRKDIEKEVLGLQEEVAERDKLGKEIEKANILISTKKEQFNDTESEIKQLKNQNLITEQGFNEQEYNLTLKSIDTKKDFIDKLDKSYIEVIGSLQGLERNKQETLAKKDRIFSIDFCPTCLQNVNSVHKHNIMNEVETSITEYNKKKSILEQESLRLSTIISKEKQELEDLKKIISNQEIQKSRISLIKQANAKLEELKKKKKGLEEDIILLEKHSLSLKERLFTFSSFDIKFKNKEEELKRAFVEEKKSEIERAELNRENLILEQEVSRLNQLLKLREQAKIKLSELIELSDWLSNNFLSLVSFIERQVMLKLRLEFSNLFKTWFSVIGGESFEVQLDENFTPVIIQGGVEMDYAFLSGGERTAVALAYRLALNQTINSIYSTIKTKDLIILDEPTEGFSEAQIDKMREVFEELNVGQLIIVSHEQKIESFVNNIIRIRKEGDSSIIEVSQDVKL